MDGVTTICVGQTISLPNTYKLPDFINSRLMKSNDGGAKADYNSTLTHQWARYSRVITDPTYM